MELSKQSKSAIMAAITDPKAALALIAMLESETAADLSALEARVEALENA